MLEFFQDGGPGMLLVLPMGFLTLYASGLFAIRGEQRFLRLTGSLALCTLAVSALFFFYGLDMSVQFLTKVPPEDRVMVLGAGFVESSHNLILGLLLLLFSALSVAVGFYRTGGFSGGSFDSSGATRQ